MSVERARLRDRAGLLVAGLPSSPTARIRFSDFTPLTSSAGPTADESEPITFGNPDFQQRSIADRDDAAGGRCAQLRQLGHEHRERDGPA